jgi:hypothetical protein
MPSGTFVSYTCTQVVLLCIENWDFSEKEWWLVIFYLLLLTCLLSCSLHLKILKTLCNYYCSYARMWTIPSAPRGFDNFFLYWKVLQFNPLHLWVVTLQKTSHWPDLRRTFSPTSTTPTRNNTPERGGHVWYVSNVSIIFDAPCLFLHHLLSVLLHFVVFLCFRKVTQEIFSELDETKAEPPIIYRSFQKSEEETKGGHRLATP